MSDEKKKKKLSDLPLRLSSEIVGNEVIPIVYLGEAYRLTLDELKTFIGVISGGSVDLTKVGSHVLPKATNTYDVGNAALHWRSLYAGSVNANTIYLGNTGFSLREADDKLHLTFGSNLTEYVATESDVKALLAQLEGKADSLSVLELSQRVGSVESKANSNASKINTLSAEATTTAKGLMSAADKRLLDKLGVFYESTDSDDVINKWKELEKFLEGLKETDSLATITAELQGQIDGLWGRNSFDDLFAGHIAADTLAAEAIYTDKVESDEALFGSLNVSGDASVSKNLEVTGAITENGQKLAHYSFVEQVNGIAVEALNYGHAHQEWIEGTYKRDYEYLDGEIVANYKLHKALEERVDELDVDVSANITSIASLDSRVSANAANLDSKQIALKTQNARYINLDSQGNISINVDGVGLKIYDGSTSYLYVDTDVIAKRDWVSKTLSSALADYLPLSGGGTVTGDTIVPLMLKSPSSAGQVLLQYYRGDDYWGALGFNASDSPIFKSVGGTQNELIHSGNIGNQSVASASTASSLANKASYLNIDANTVITTDKDVKYYSGIPNTSTNIPTANAYQNGLLALGLHGNGATAQLYFSKGKPLYYRANIDESWRKVLDDINLGDVVSDGLTFTSNLLSVDTDWLKSTVGGYTMYKNEDYTTYKLNTFGLVNNAGPYITFGSSDKYYTILRTIGREVLQVRKIFETIDSGWKTVAFTDSTVAAANSLVNVNGTPAISTSSFDTVNISGTVSITRSNADSTDVDQYGNIKFKTLSSVGVKDWSIQASNNGKLLVFKNTGQLLIGGANYTGDERLYVDGSVKVSESLYVDQMIESSYLRISTSIEVGKSISIGGDSVATVPYVDGEASGLWSRNSFDDLYAGHLMSDTIATESIYTDEINGGTPITSATINSTFFTFPNSGLSLKLGTFITTDEYGIAFDYESYANLILGNIVSDVKSWVSGNYHPLITSNSKLSYSLIDGTPDMSLYAKDTELRWLMSEVSTIETTVEGHNSKIIALENKIGDGYITDGDLDEYKAEVNDNFSNLLEALNKVDDEVNALGTSVSSLENTVAGKQDKLIAARHITLDNQGNMSINVDGVGLKIYDGSTSYLYVDTDVIAKRDWVSKTLSSALADYLPLSGGGTVTGDTIVPLMLKSPSSAGQVLLQYYRGDDYWGALGFNASDSPIFKSVGGTQNELIHSGNIGNQSVASASTASSLANKASYLNIDANTVITTDKDVKYYSGIPNTSTNIPTANAYQNGLLALGLHGNGATAQLYFSKGKPLYYRANIDESWRKVLDDINLGDVVSDGLTFTSNLLSVDTDWLKSTVGGYTMYKNEDYTTYKLNTFGLVNNAGPYITFGSSDKYYTILRTIGREVLQVRKIFETIDSGWKTVAFTDSTVAAANSIVNSSNQTLLHQASGFITATGGLRIGNNHQYCGLYPNIKITSAGNEKDLWLYNQENLRLFGTTGVSINVSQNANIVLASSNGNVGIGTENPEAKLHVEGSGKFTDSVDVGDSVTAGWLTLSTDLFVGGNVGIGTTSPTRKLHINDASGFPASLQSNREFTALGFSQRDEGVAYLVYYGGENWKVTNNNWSKEYTIIHSGNYATYLDGYAPMSSVEALSDHLTSLQGQTLNISTKVDLLDDWVEDLEGDYFEAKESLQGQIDSLWARNSFDELYATHVMSDTLAVEEMFTDKLTIGNAPIEYVVHEGLKLSTAIYIDGSSVALSNQLPTTTQKNNWNTAYGWGNHASAGYASLKNVDGHTFIKLSGGIESEDSWALRIGTDYFNGSTQYAVYANYGSGNVHLGTPNYRWNTVYAVTVNQSSDATLKDVIGDTSLTLSQIANAPAVSFTWKYNGKKDVGTLAQYWKDVLPEIVSGEEGNMGMNYAALGVVSAIILARNVETHEQRISRLERENEELRKEILTLKNR